MEWLRLWHDLPNDPKWRTISRVSNRPISEVIAVFIHMLVCASNATERGRTQGWNDEDVASALDLEAEHVQAIRDAMQGRVLEGDIILGWQSRQPKREDNSALRSKAWREAKKAERTRTHPNAKERPEKSREEKKEDSGTVVPSSIPNPLPEWMPKDAWEGYLQMRMRKRATPTEKAIALIIAKLDDWRAKGHDPKAILEKSITSNWTDIYEPKEGNHGTPKRHAKFEQQNYLANTGGFVVG